MGEVTGSKMPRLDLEQRWLFLGAYRLGIAAARMEIAATGRVSWVGYFSGKDDSIFLGCGIWFRHTGQKRLSVRMFGIVV